MSGTKETKITFLSSYFVLPTNNYLKESGVRKRFIHHFNVKKK